MKHMRATSLILRNRWFWIALLLIVYQGCWLLFLLPPNLFYIGHNVFWSALGWRMIQQPQYVLCALVSVSLFVLSIKKDDRIFKFASLSSAISSAFYLSLPDAGPERWDWVWLAFLMPYNIIYIVIVVLMGIPVLVFLKKLSDTWLRYLFLLALIVALCSLSTCTMNSSWNYYSEGGGSPSLTR